MRLFIMGHSLNKSMHIWMRNDTYVLLLTTVESFEMKIGEL